MRILLARTGGCSNGRRGRGSISSGTTMRSIRREIERQLRQASAQKVGITGYLLAIGGPVRTELNRSEI